jgi:hypothetical protein
MQKIVKATKGMAQGQQWHNSIGFITGLLIGSKKPKQIADAHMSGYVGLYEHMYAKIVKATKGMAQGQQWHNSMVLITGHLSKTYIHR